MIRELAENANTYAPLGAGQERLVTDRYVIWLGPGSFPAFTVVQRLRLADDGVDDAVEEIRGVLRARGRSACTWEVADSATPPDLVARLRALGMTDDSDPVAIGMALQDKPQGARAAGVDVSRVEGAADAEAAARIAGAAFAMPEEDVDELVANMRDTESSSDILRYLARVEGQPVASATAAFTPHGAILYGGATLPEARGRGCYRALVWARWDDAARGTPVLITHAGAMSRPILERLGFEPICRIDILVDRFY